MMNLSHIGERRHPIGRALIDIAAKASYVPPDFAAAQRALPAHGLSNPMGPTIRRKRSESPQRAP
jgi:hypothetical protein